MARRVYVGGTVRKQSNGLPIGYTQVKWIQSNGSQYIDTGFAPNQNTRVVMDVEIQLNGATGAIFGGRTLYASNDFSFWGVDANSGLTNYGNVSNSISYSVDGRHLIDKDKNVTKLDGVTINTATANTFQSPCNLYLLAAYETTGVDGRNGKGKLYSCKVYDNGTLIRDFIPCVNANGTAGLYDLVNKKFYTNAGTDKFTVPVPVELPSGYKQVEWIQSTGTQYIDTGISVPHASEKVVVEFAPMDVGYDNVLTGHAAPEWSWATNLTFILDARLWVANTGVGLKAMVVDTFYKFEYTSTYYKLDDSEAISLTAINTSSYTDGYNSTLFYSSTKYGKYKVKSYKLYNGSTLVRNLIPCVNASGEVGMYDLVNSKFYGNAGTGQFIAPVPVKLPSGYKQVEYLQSNGTQYVDTGVAFTSSNYNKIKFVIDMKIPNTNTAGSYAVMGTGNTNKNCFYIGATDNKIVIGNGLSDISTSATYDYTRRTWTMDAVSARASVSGLYDSSFELKAPNTSMNLLLFGYNSSTIGKRNAIIYGCQIYENGTQIRNFIPCTNADGTAGLYDLVNSKFYGNNGTGTFAVGTEIPAEIPTEIPTEIVETTNVARKVKQICVGVDGVARVVNSGYVGVNGVARQFWKGGKPLGEFEVGSTVKLNVNGTPREFIIVNQGSPSSLYDSSCNGTWLLMKDIYQNSAWNSTQNNNYENSTIHSYLNGSFLNMFDSAIKSVIKQVKIPYRKGTGSGGTTVSGSNGLSTKIFLLSNYEVGWTTANFSYIPVDGACLDYFRGCAVTDSKRIGYYNGGATRWHLRSALTTNTASVCLVLENGSMSNDVSSNARGTRPALILPFDTFVPYDLLITCED